MLTNAPDNTILYYALSQWANHIETGNLTLSASDAAARDLPVKRLDTTQQQFVARVRELASTFLQEKTPYSLWSEFLLPVQQPRPDLPTELQKLCGLCANSGVIHLGDAVSAAGAHVVSADKPCICPNGRELKKHGHIRPHILHIPPPAQ